MWALGLFEIIFFAVFFILLAIGTTFDRRGREEPKWYIFGVGLVIIVAWFWNDFTFLGAWDTIRTWSFWEPVAAYLGAGLVYSILEFVLDVRRSARQYKTRWDQHLGSRIEVKQLTPDGSGYRSEENPRRGGNTIVTKDLTVREVLTNSEEVSNSKVAKELVSTFVSNNSGRQSYGFVGLAVDDTGLAPEPKIDKVELAEHVGAWTFFWPAYAVSLVLGDLLTEIFQWLADALVKLSGRFVRMSFAGVFKF
jgi:hypothetical protein